MSAFDSHAHLDIASAGDPQRLQSILRQAFKADIRGILVPAFHPERWSTLTQLVLEAHKQSNVPRLFVAIGVHPWALKELRLDQERAALFELHLRCHARPRLPAWVAIGEAGLDFRITRSDTDKARQIRVLREQMIMARRTQMPMILHCVGAYGPLMKLLRELEPPSSIIHGFSGKRELARQLCQMGHYLGVGPIILREQTKHLRQSLAAIPRERILLESDADDPTQPLHGPHPLLDIATQAAKCVGCTPEDLRNQSYANARRVLRLDRFSGGSARPSCD